MEQIGASTTPAALTGGGGLGNKPKSQRSRAMSAYARADSFGPTVTFRRPYSAYTKRDGEAENMPKYDDERTNREWWRYYVKVNMLMVAWVQLRKQNSENEWALR